MNKLSVISILRFRHVAIFSLFVVFLIAISSCSQNQITIEPTIPNTIVSVSPIIESPSPHASETSIGPIGTQYALQTAQAARMATAGARSRATRYAEETIIALTPTATFTPTPTPTPTPLTTPIPSLSLAVVRNQDLPDAWRVYAMEWNRVPIDPVDRTIEIREICMEDCVKLVWTTPFDTFTVILNELSTSEAAVKAVGDLWLSYKQRDNYYLDVYDPYDDEIDSRWAAFFNFTYGDYHILNYVLVRSHNQVLIVLVYRFILTEFVPDIDSYSTFLGIDYYEKYQIQKLTDLGY